MDQEIISRLIITEVSLVRTAEGPKFEIGGIAKETLRVHPCRECGEAAVLHAQDSDGKYIVWINCTGKHTVKNAPSVRIVGENPEMAKVKAVRLWNERFGKEQP